MVKLVRNHITTHKALRFTPLHVTVWPQRRFKPFSKKVIFLLKNFKIPSFYVKTPRTNPRNLLLNQVSHFEPYLRSFPTSVGKTLLYFFRFFFFSAETLTWYARKVWRHILSKLSWLLRSPMGYLHFTLLSDSIGTYRVICPKPKTTVGG